MKGIILYKASSKNTKILAQRIYDRLKDDFSIELKAVKAGEPLADADYYLIGGACHYGKFNKSLSKLLKEVGKKPVGLFATAGTGHIVNYNLKFRGYLEGLLVGKKSLGVYVCPGKIDYEFYWPVRLIPSFIFTAISSQTRDTSARDLPVKEELLLAYKTARPANEEELEEAGKFFYRSLKETLPGKEKE